MAHLDETARRRRSPRLYFRDTRYATVVVEYTYRAGKCWRFSYSLGTNASLIGGVSFYNFSSVIRLRRWAPFSMADMREIDIWS